MPSSTSSSKPAAPHGIVKREGALPAGLRLTASDRPGQAQPVPTRDIPKQPWGRLALGVVAALVIGTAAMEVNARRLGLHAGDLDNSEVDWTVERTRSAGAPIAIVGDSRILFDTDLDRFEALTGVRPVQLAIHGTSALSLLEDTAANKAFNGLLIVGLADTMFFQPFDGYGGYIHKRENYESPARHWSAGLDHFVQRRFAFLDNLHHLIMPEWSHLSRRCATVFTDAYVRRLAARTDRIRLVEDAPRPLTRDDCVAPDGKPL